MGICSILGPDPDPEPNMDPDPLSRKGIRGSGSASKWNGSETLITIDSFKKQMYHLRSKVSDQKCHCAMCISKSMLNLYKSYVWSYKWIWKKLYYVCKNIGPINNNFEDIFSLLWMKSMSGRWGSSNSWSKGRYLPFPSIIIFTGMNNDPKKLNPSKAQFEKS